MGVLLVFAGCSYKPVTVWTKEALGDQVYVEVAVSPTDPENTVFIKDAVMQAVRTELGSSLSTKEASRSQIYVKLQSVSFAPMQRDGQGYVVSYRTTTSLSFQVYDRDGQTKSFSTSGSYDFAIEPSSVISESKRFESIKESSAKAIDQAILQLAAYRIKRQSH